MNVFIAAFTNNVLPILLAAGAGVILGWKTDIHPESLSKLAMYVLTPSLIFELLTSNPISGADILVMLAFTAAVTLAVVLLMGGLGFALRWPKSIIAAAVLASLATNAGNYGLSLNQFAFGAPALPYASLFMVGNSLITYTLGIAVASWGSGKPGNPLTAPFKYPLLYAFLLGLVFSRFHLSLPLPVDRVVSLFSAGAIPTMLVLLGVQLSKCNWQRPSLALSLTNATRLITSPVLAIGLAAIFALQGPARQAGILQAAMPTAVTATVLAAEFNLEPSFLTVSVVLSTLFSALTLTPLIVFLS